MDCRTCRAAHARYCADCVQELAAERQKALAEYESENRRLAHIMSKGLEDLTRVRSRADAQREHAELVARLSANLATVRSEADRLAVSVNELRHAVRRTSARFARTKAGAPAAGVGGAFPSTGKVAGGVGSAAGADCATASSAGASSAQDEAEHLRVRLSDRRRHLLRELLAWASPAEASAALWGGRKGGGDIPAEGVGGVDVAECEGLPPSRPPLVLFQHLMLPPPPPPVGQSAAAGLRCAPLSALLGPTAPQGIPEAESQVGRRSWDRGGAYVKGRLA
jgi:hypothetical protein